MGKCFITKLPAEVNNDDLPVYGKFNINFTPLDSNTARPRRGVRLAFSKDAELKVIGKGYFTNVDKSQNLGTTLSIKGDNTANSIYVSDEVSRISVDKYTLTWINGYAEDSGFAGRNTIIDLQDLKYTSLTGLNLTDINVTGDISALSGLTQLNNLTLYGANVNITGDISSLSGLTNLVSISIQNSDVNNITVGLINEWQSLITAIIPSISGDIAKVHDGMQYIMIANNKVIKGFPVSWSAKSRQNKKLLCLPSASTSYLDFGTDLDNMLIDQATCNYTDIGNYYGNIRVKGTRTSASDSALASIQNKGVTVTILS